MHIKWNPAPKLSVNGSQIKRRLRYTIRKSQPVPGAQGFKEVQFDRKLQAHHIHSNVSANNTPADRLHPFGDYGLGIGHQDLPGKFNVGSNSSSSVSIFNFKDILVRNEPKFKIKRRKPRAKLLKLSENNNRKRLKPRTHCVRYRQTPQRRLPTKTQPLAPTESDFLQTDRLFVDYSNGTLFTQVQNIKTMAQDNFTLKNSSSSKPHCNEGDLRDLGYLKNIQVNSVPAQPNMCLLNQTASEIQKETSILQNFGRIYRLVRGTPTVLPRVCQTTRSMYPQKARLTFHSWQRCPINVIVECMRNRPYRVSQTIFPPSKYDLTELSEAWQNNVQMTTLMSFGSITTIIHQNKGIIVAASGMYLTEPLDEQCKAQSFITRHYRISQPQVHFEGLFDNCSSEQISFESSQNNSEGTHVNIIDGPLFLINSFFTCITLNQSDGNVTALLRAICISEHLASAVLQDKPYCFSPQRNLIQNCSCLKELTCFTNVHTFRVGISCTTWKSNVFPLDFLYLGIRLCKLKSSGRLISDTSSGIDSSSTMVIWFPGHRSKTFPLLSNQKGFGNTTLGFGTLLHECEFRFLIYPSKTLSPDNHSVGPYDVNYWSSYMLYETPRSFGLFLPYERYKLDQIQHKLYGSKRSLRISSYFGPVKRELLWTRWLRQCMITTLSGVLLRYSVFGLKKEDLIPFAGVCLALVACTVICNRKIYCSSFPLWSVLTNLSHSK